MKYSKPANVALILFFALLLIAPHVVELWEAGSQAPSVEQRKMAARPDTSLILKSFPGYAAQFEQYYQDSFGLREQMIRWNNRLRLLLFAESPIPGVRIGRDGWLFYANEWALEEYENVIPYKDRDLAKIKEITEERIHWLERRGMKLFILVAPEKATIYGEYLPPAIHRIGSQSRLDQLADYLRSDPGIEFIDPRDALFRAKQVQRLYHRTDTHWNGYGALIGYVTLMERIAHYFPAVRIPSAGDFMVSAAEGRGGDIARMLSLDDVIKEERITVAPKFTPRAVDGSRPYPDPVDTAVYPGRGMVVKETKDPRLPKALVFRDSFASPLIPLLAESFQSTVFVWTHDFLPELIEREKPDLIIFECVERYLNALTKGNPALLSLPRSRAEMQAGL
jgi:alginate O-acetyltransferase complex protein AlgJ